jgi:hypothetical protein
MNFYLHRLQQDISEAIGGLSDEQLAWQPGNKWSSAQILEHLYLTYTGTTKGFERCFAANAPLAHRPKWDERLRTLVVIRCAYLPAGRKAPGAACPRGLPPDLVRTEIFSRIAEMDDLIERAVQTWGPDTRLLDHPILGPLRGFEWCKFHWVHGNHHLKQIRQALKLFASSRA